MILFVKVFKHPISGTVCTLITITFIYQYLLIPRVLYLLIASAAKQSLLRVKSLDKQLQTLSVQIVSIKFLNALYLPSFSPFLLKL